MPTDATSELLRYYREELSYLRRMGGTFAQRFPAVAARLELGPDIVPDPHVERLIESFAFLTARIQRDLDASLPEITTALLSALYPHYVAPTPSMGIARFIVEPSAAKLKSGFLVPKHTPLFATSGRERPLTFRTGYPVTLWPLRVESAALVSPDRFPFLDFASDVASVLRISIECTAGTFAEIDLRELRFHINSDTRVGNVLYESLFHDLLRVAVVADGSATPRILPATAVEPVGFDPGEELLPMGPHGYSGYALLQEYFAFPAKFAFFDVGGLEGACTGTKLDLLFLLNRPPGQRLTIDAETFALGCTPIVNLFPRVAEPVRLDRKTTEYRLVPDQQREASTEIHSILRVASQLDSDDDSVTFQPFFSFDHAAGSTRPRAFWASRVQPVTRADIPGSETLISLVDLDFNPMNPGVPSLYVRALCTNRHLAEQLPTGAALQCELGGPIAGVVTLQRPTAQRDTPLGGGNQWKLISHLTLNHLSIEGPDAMRALREMLRLYAGDDPLSLRQIAGVRELDARRVMRRIGGDAWRGFCRGMQVSITLDESDFVGSNPYLFGAVLSRFFAQHAAVNSFTQLRLFSAQREGIWKEWPPATGTQIVA
jgi:type VI secretion system protein ImpG